MYLGVGHTNVIIIYRPTDYKQLCSDMTERVVHRSRTLGNELDAEPTVDLGKGVSIYVKGWCA